ncbi:Glycosyl transferase [Rhodovastum atsumiense]|uniref:Glycosyl transferase n=1 Tax=Rhodovastum atsumiense TaxID=504468 RepID=A0A5M6ILX3_9PROT|nr:glycosyltransferase family 39 protein [Rhodovastum atsumiense]KAA5608927.1 glycosyl transferase [Rhodovastum atsumiense]CAH2604220.1 Glycosyl transferase [Rhodovastum atsumiense]
MRRLVAIRYPLLALLAALLLWPGMNLIPPFDRDESRYAQATAQMLASGDLIDVRFQDQPRYLQPAGIYWLQASSVSLLSSPEAREIWANRVPSAIAAVVAVLLTCWIGSTLFGPQAGLVAGLLLACSVLLGVEARMAKIDATLLAVILAAQAALLAVWRSRDATPARLTPWLFWAANGVGLMLKGPVVLLVTLGTLAGLAIAERRVRWMRGLRPLPGIALMLAIVLPWVIGIVLVSGGTFFADSLGQNFLGKVATGQQAHGLPPGYYLLAFLISFWPGSLFAALALPWTWANRRRPEVTFLLAWIIPTWVVFELVATKLPHYVLPTYPAIACLAAAACCRADPWPMGRWGRALTGIYAALWLLVGLGLAFGGPGLLGWVEHEASLLAGLVALLGAPLAVWAWRLARRRAAMPALACAAGAAAAIYAGVWLAVLPQLHTIWLSPRIAETVARLRPCPDSVLASASFSEPSLIYLVGRETRLIGPADAADFLKAGPACNLALVDARDAPAFLGRAGTLGLAPRALGLIEGINYSNGKRLALTLYSAAP